MVDKLLVVPRRQCWATYSGEATVRKIAVCARAKSALLIVVGSPPAGTGMALMAPRIWLLNVDDIWPPSSNMFTRSSSCCGLLARPVSVTSVMYLSPLLPSLGGERACD